MTKFIPACCFILLVIATDLSAQGLTSPQLSGTLIYGLGKSLYSVDLAAGKKSEIAVRPDGAVQDGMTKVGADRILIGGSGDIVEYNLSTRAFKTLGKGDYPLAIPSKGVLFFYGLGLKLVRAQLHDQDLVQSEVEAGPYRSPKPILAISQDEIVFQGGTYDAVWHYQIDKNVLSKLPLVDCAPQIWRDKTKQLLCWSQKDKGYYLTDLGAKSVVKIPELARSVPVIYVESADALLLNEAAFGFLPPEKYDLTVFFFDGAKKKMIARDALVARRTAVLLE